MAYKEKYQKIRSRFYTAAEENDALTATYKKIGRKLKKISHENSHLLDLVMELRPEIGEDLSSSSEEILSEGSVDSSDSEKQAEVDTESEEEAIFPSLDPRNKTRAHKAEHEREKKSTQTRRSIDPSVKRKRRTGKRDDRTDAKPIEHLPKNEKGELILPVTVGKGGDEVTIINIGKVVWDREPYHTPRFIWPVGFHSEKIYTSMLDGNKKTTYVSEILDGGEAPVFQVTAEDQPGRKFVANSASGVWKQVLDEIMAKGFGAKTHASGPQLYGINNLGITKHIQELPGAEKCSKYVMQRWIDSGNERHKDQSDIPNIRITNYASETESGSDGEEKTHRHGSVSMSDHESE
ncbi:hypothetical protein K493DRAFT_339943 [Basidiobolus meristosporus CBS 931.73]|uniref:INO80 complex subunit 3 N-terminal domain-containing protein n=1 Tax=Basidiobolus meristosporus CBS 931.73 TaxID=1314790 RepID=A0A1Y1XXP4_9FUNG|nr:hypothetical protein K493DRAFT_339943 [Basidiobolus meristosporus CBS 931.73]|eukprot:ORX90517.1 hypothetical protein K493DRAFT_339943 [Basidiobolus meristosporus CBS 931.73]